MPDKAVQVSIVSPIPAATVEPPKQLTLTQRIDADEGLKAKRKLLTVVSLILLAIAFSAAKVVEANTFIMKISFTNQNGIAYLLLLSIAFLMIRYYNYARPYHDELYKAWTERILKEPFLFIYCHESDQATGILVDKAPSKLDFESVRHNNHGYWNFEYKCYGIFGREIHHLWSNDGQSDNRTTLNLFKELDLSIYFKILLREFKYQASSFFIHRENLDIFAPYLLGCFSILSFVFNEEIIAILKGFTS
jgi:hypothetical protein